MPLVEGFPGGGGDPCSLVPFPWLVFPCSHSFFALVPCLSAYRTYLTNQVNSAADDRFEHLTLKMTSVCSLLLLEFFKTCMVLTKNKTQTAVMNMTDKRIVRKKLDLLLDVSYASTYIFRSDR